MKNNKTNTIAFDTLLLEVTRKCNLKCEHCFRGEPQNISMSKELIDSLINQLDFVQRISLTGGEPFMVPEVIEYLVNKIIDSKLKFMTFTLVVNGTILDERAIRSIKALNRLGEYLFTYIYPNAYQKDGKSFNFEAADNKEERLIDISISTDEFHKNDPDKAIDFYSNIANQYLQIKRQDNWSEYSEGLEDLSGKGLSWVKSEGRAADNNIGNHQRYCESCSPYCHRVNIEDNIVKCMTQICANGNVILCGESSYKHEDELSMGNILITPIWSMIQENEWKQPLLCEESDSMFDIKNLIDELEKGNDTYSTYLDIQTDSTEEIKDILQRLFEGMLLKRDVMRMAHEQLPYLNYEEIVDVVDADINVRTEGNFAKYMRLYYKNYKEKYLANWKYSFLTEQSICNKYKRLNNLRSLGLKKKSSLPYKLKSCEATKESIY